MAYRKVGRHLVACPSCLHSSSLTFTRPCRARGLSAVLSELVATPRWCLGSFTAGWLSTARGRSSSLASIETCAAGLQHIHAIRRCTCNFFSAGLQKQFFSSTAALTGHLLFRRIHILNSAKQMCGKRSPINKGSSQAQAPRASLRCKCPTKAFS